MPTPSPLDPAQLLALDVLLEERSVTKAAQRLGITQSSMSHRLAVLREALGDALFVRRGSSLVPTPRALAMATPLHEALRALSAAVAPPTPFDAASARFVLEIAMPDLLAPVAPRLVAALLAGAPHAEIRLAGIIPELGKALGGDVPKIALTPLRFVEGDTRSQPLGELAFGIAGRADHPALRRPLTTTRWLAHPHVVVQVGNERTNVIEDELTRRGLGRRVGLVVPSFLSGLLVAARSDFLMNVPLPLAREAAGLLGLRIRPAPIPLPTVRFALAWHPRYQADPAHRWSRERVLEAMRPMFGAMPRAEHPG